MNKIKTQLIIISLIIINSIIITAQNPTIGLRYTEGNASDGYTLFSPEENNSVYLIGNCGEKINEWTFSEPPGATCYFLENGTLLRAGRDSLEIRDWNNNLIWSYAMTDNGFNQHHDIEPLPNGNILCIMNDIYSIEEMTEEGRDPTITNDNFKLDKIVELQPQGTNDANVVWEWKFIDHVIQDFDDAKLNFGVVIDHPELLDLNYDNGALFSWIHLNAIDYNANLDQIIVSARNMHELYIIDHSTTTAEAAGNIGGNANMGGNFLWRWGNPMVYKTGVADDQILFGQHDCKWVESGYLDEGTISVFNNRGDGTATFSNVGLIRPEIIDGVYTKTANMFNPTDFESSWNGSILGEIMNDGKKSGVQILSNGNMLTTETSKGQVSEITKEGTILWVYKNPSDVSIYNQLDEIVTNENRIFRAVKYPIDFVGFAGLSLSTSGTIEEQNTLSENCLIVSISDYTELEKWTINNPINNGFIQFSENITADFIRIFNIEGKLIFSDFNFNGNTLKTYLNNGIYFIQIQVEERVEVRKVVFK
ncbi:MAG: hypothetical protein ACI94Y_001460 [Maribacter sp.]|jgi:hypothetical protein